MQQQFSTRNYSVRDCEEWQERSELVLAPKFQRRDVGNPKAKSYLMDTIIRGKPIPKLAEAKPSNVINLMDALKRSVKAEQGGGKTTHSRRRPARRSGTPRKRAAHHRTRAKRAS